MEQERRSTPRYPFFASAEVTEIESGTRLSARTSELGLHGCYLDLVNPLPEGTRVEVQLNHAGATVQAQGNVVYSHSNMGMGIAFTSVAAEYEAVLQQWLRELRSA